MKEFACLCGKCFKGSQSYNGHKRHCKVGRTKAEIDKIVSADKAISIYRNQKRSNIRKQKKQEEIQIWKSESHYCEWCGKLLTERYVTGRFCNRSCANAFSSKIAKQNSESFRAYKYGSNKKTYSPYEKYIADKLTILGVDFIWNATRPKYTDVIGHTYILDFYLPLHKIDLEYDGRLHKDSVEYDRQRDNYLNSIGVEVYRIKHYDTDKSLDELFDDFCMWYKTKYIAV